MEWEPKWIMQANIQKIDHLEVVDAGFHEIVEMREPWKERNWAEGRHVGTVGIRDNCGRSDMWNVGDTDDTYLPILFWSRES